jgi:hypothetical protein
VFLACTDPVDRAAKQRIFSAEDPPQAVAAASQKLPPQEAADHPEVARRILEMGAAEATERLGPHRYTATVDWEWTQGGHNLRLKENRELIAGPGGVLGDFHARLSNLDDVGLEVLRVGGRVFARNTWGKDGEARFRQRARDRGVAERLREEACGAVRDLDQLFRGRLKLAAQSTADHTASFEGRTAWKYAVSLAEAVPESPGRLPAPLAPRTGVDDTTRRRAHFYEARSPLSLQGEVLVDAQTSVVLRAHLVGRMVVKGQPDAGAPEAELRITVDATRADVGKTLPINPPADFLPDEDKPDGVAAALARFGLSHKGDAGTLLADVPEEVEDEAPPPEVEPAAGAGGVAAAAPPHSTPSLAGAEARDGGAAVAHAKPTAKVPPKKHKKP